MDVSFGENGGKMIEITVDSAAEESACPQNWGKQFGMEQVEQNMNLVNAIGVTFAIMGRGEWFWKLHILFEG